MLYKRSVLKNFSKFTDKHKKQSSRDVLPKEKMFLKIFQNSQRNVFAGVTFLIELQAGNLKLLEVATGGTKISQISKEKICIGISFQ